jgi:hypothetical protein
VTAWSQIVADQLGVPFDDVSVLYGDTGSSVKGMDTYGSRSLAGGRRGHGHACEKVRDKAKVIAAHLLECSARRPGVQGRARSGSRATPRRPRRWPRSHSRPSPRTTCRTGSNRSWIRRPPSIRPRFSFPHGTQPLRHRRGHRDRSGHHPQVRRG